jgi:60 kDa SS-A/Ro ribonucleoprotein
MSRLNLPAVSAPVLTHEGGPAHATDSYRQLRRSVLTCLLWEDTFYETGNEIANRIAELVPQVDPQQVADLAREARDRLRLRHVPLFLLRVLARRKGTGPILEKALAHVIQRADELAEFLAMYWNEKRQPLAAGVKRGLAAAFGKFDEYRLAKYDRANKIKLRDVLFLVHAKPKDEAQAALWKRLVAGELAAPDTWEVELSAGKDKKETFERLLREGKLGGLAVLRNLRNMQQAGVDEALIRTRLDQGIARALPFRFVTAAGYAPNLEDALEAAMLKGIAELQLLPGRTGLLVDVSGSMDEKTARKSETTRIDAAAGLAILLREKTERLVFATFSNQVAVIPPRRGFALRDAIKASQPHQGTYLRRALELLRDDAQAAGWSDLDRVIVITDEQSHDGILPAFTKLAYVVNVAPYKHGVSYRDGWTHIDGWSERVIDYVRETEADAA